MMIDATVFNEELVLEVLEHRQKHIEYRIRFRKETWEFAISRFKRYDMFATEQMARTHAFILYTAQRNWNQN